MVFLRPVLTVALATVFSLPTAGQEEEGGYKPPSSYPDKLFRHGDWVYFSADDGQTGRELWRASTRLRKVEQVADITPGMDGTAIDAFYATDRGLYFRISGRPNGGELWWTDGEPDGRTERVVHDPGAVPSFGVQAILGGVDNVLLLGMGNSLGSKVIWRYDEKTRASGPLKVYGGGVLMSRSSFGGYRDGYLYFSATASVADGEVHEGLWRSDGSAKGTEIVAPVKGAGDFVALGERGLVFVGEHEDHGKEVWVTRGTGESTKLLCDIWDGPGSSDPNHLTFFDHEEDSKPPVVFFTAEDEQHGRELWETDGTTAGTKMVVDWFAGMVVVEFVSAIGC